MSAWDDSHWTGYNAEILNVLAGPDGIGWIEFKYVDLWYVGWRRLKADTAVSITNLLEIATVAKHGRNQVLLRATNSSGPGGLAEVTALQTV